MTAIAIKRALLSVYDKAGLVELAAALHGAGAELVSTGSTAATIERAGIPVTRVEDLTGFPECLDGRVKTLHPRVHAGLLADLANPDHERQLAELGIAPFQLLVSNLYPFEQTVASGATPPEIIEQIDIGGPAMVRAAAKNHGSVAVVTSPGPVRRRGQGARQRRVRPSPSGAAWRPPPTRTRPPTTRPSRPGSPPATRRTRWRRRPAGPTSSPRSGAGPTCSATARTRTSAAPCTRPAAPRRGPTPASPTPRCCTARRCPTTTTWTPTPPAAPPTTSRSPAWRSSSTPTRAGSRSGANIAAAHAKALACDPLSAYGGVVAANSAVTDAMAEQITDGFAEVVIAPGFDPAAVEILTAKWKNIRLLRCDPPPWGAAAAATVEPRIRSISSDFEFRPVSGGLLAQTWDRVDQPGDDPAGWELKAGTAADAATLADLAFAWRACRAVKSNAILLAAGGASVGVGMGQVNRVDSARLAVARAGNRAAGSVAASDAFFPFPDGFEILAEAGVRAVVEPGGSIRDDGVIAAAQAAGVTLYFTGVRHFYH